jgi:hypothetical protein
MKYRKYFLNLHYAFTILGILSLYEPIVPRISVPVRLLAVVFEQISIFFSFLLLPLWSIGLISQFLGHFTDGRSPWRRDELVARPLPKHRTTHTQNKRIHTPNINALSALRTHGPGFRASEDSSRLRPLGYRDRQISNYCTITQLWTQQIPNKQINIIVLIFVYYVHIATCFDPVGSSSDKYSWNVGVCIIVLYSIHERMRSIKIWIIRSGYLGYFTFSLFRIYDTFSIWIVR